MTTEAKLHVFLTPAERQAAQELCGGKRALTPEEE